MGYDILGLDFRIRDPREVYTTPIDRKNRRDHI